MITMQLEKLLIELVIIAVENGYLAETNDIYCWLEQSDKKYLESALLISNTYFITPESISNYFSYCSTAKLAINKKEHADLIKFALALIADE